MRTDVLFPDGPTIIDEGGRRYVRVPWARAESVRVALARRGCPTTLCLNPETREARLELWPDASPAVVLAYLETRQTTHPAKPVGRTLSRDRESRPTPPPLAPADLICI